MLIFLLKTLLFKEPVTKTSVIVEKDVPLKENLKELTRDAQQLAPEEEKKKKNNIGNLIIVGSIKQRELWLEPNNNTVRPKALNFPLLTAVHA